MFLQLVTTTLVLCLTSCNAGITSGRYRGSDSWHFLDRFCFEKGKGNLHGEFLFPAHLKPTLMAYFLETKNQDEFSGWSSIYSGQLNCSEKLTLAKDTSGAVFDLTDPKYMDKVEMVDDKLMMRSTITSSVVTSRSRWFFFAVGNCLDSSSQAQSCETVEQPDGSFSVFCDAGVDMYWYFNFTNGDGSNMYFGADKSSVFATSIAFTVLYVVLGAYAFHVRQILVGMRKCHVTVKIVFASILAGFLRVVLESIAFGNFRSSGVEGWTFHSLAIACSWIADVSLVLALMLLMKGWTIVRRKISAMGRTRIAAFLVVYTCTLIACTLYFNYGVEHALVVYVYDSWPGYILISLRVGLFLWIVRAYYVTLRKYNAKRGFYTKFSALAAIWVLSVPILVGINYFVAEYMRFKLVYGLELSFLYFTQMIIICMYNPKSAIFGSSFPFHATTTAMLQGRAGARGGTSHIADIHLRQATEISRRVKKSVTVLQGFSTDLMGFLEEIDPAEDELISKDEELPLVSTGQGLPSTDETTTKKKKKRSVDPRPSSTSLSVKLK